MVLRLSNNEMEPTGKPALIFDRCAAKSAQQRRTESGTTIVVSYPTDSTAIVEYDGRRLQMEIAVSGSGARYVGEGLEWWTKGSEEGASGTLFHHLDDGTSGEAIEECAQVSGAA